MGFFKKFRNTIFNSISINSSNNDTEISSELIELESKKEEAKLFLIKLIKTYKEIDGFIHTLKKPEDREDLLPEIESHINKYYEFKELLEHAKNVDYFPVILNEYLSSQLELDSNYDNPALRLKLLKHLERVANDELTEQKKIERVLFDWDIMGRSTMHEWESEKETIEKAIARKKKKIRPSATSNASSSDDIENNTVMNAEKNQNPTLAEVFDILPDCIITDIETSGLVYNKNSIIEIAAIKIIDGRIAESYSSLIHRDKPLSSKVTSLTGITTAMLRECDKNLEEVITEYRDFIGNLPLVGHNIISFDIKFINEAYLKVFGTPINNSCIDTLKLSYEHLYDVESHSLQSLASYINAPPSVAHRALDDCKTTAYLYKYMMSIAGSVLLKWSKKGKAIDNTGTCYPKYVTQKYPSGMCLEFHKKMISLGYLIQADTTTILNTYTVSELKDILKKHSLAISGNKTALINRIIQNIDTQLLDLTILFVPSEKGIEFHDKYAQY